MINKQDFKKKNAYKLSSFIYGLLDIFILHGRTKLNCDFSLNIFFSEN